MLFFSKNPKIASVFGLSPRKSVLFSILIISLLIAPAVTHASVFSFLADMFSGTKVSAESQTYIESNSQNMAILEPAITTDPSTKSAGDLTVVGNEALLPEVGPSTLAPDSIDSSNGQISVYTVRSGDTFASIASMFDVSVNTILWANDLNKSSVIKTGETLVILPMSGVMHTVVSGDTLKSIAKKYNGDVDEIAQFNELKVTDKLVVGDTVMIPDGEASYSVSTPKSGTAIYISGKKVSEPLLVNPSTLPDYSGYYTKPYIVGTKTQGLHGHNAVDFGMPTGSSLYAAAQGIVIISKSSGYNGGYGKYIVIQHPNGTQTLYGHMSNPIVTVGQSVTQGQLIGYSGNTGLSTGPHLHFEVRGAKNPF